MSMVQRSAVGYALRTWREGFLQQPLRFVGLSGLIALGVDVACHGMTGQPYGTAALGRRLAAAILSLFAMRSSASWIDLTQTSRVLRWLLGPR